MTVKIVLFDYMIFDNRRHTSDAAEYSSTIAGGFSHVSTALSVFFSIPSSGYMPYVAAKKVNDTPGIDF